MKDGDPGSCRCHQQGNDSSRENPDPFPFGISARSKTRNPFTTTFPVRF